MPTPMGSVLHYRGLHPKAGRNIGGNNKQRRGSGVSAVPVVVERGSDGVRAKSLIRHSSSASSSLPKRHGHISGAKSKRPNSDPRSKRRVIRSYRSLSKSPPNGNRLAIDSLKSEPCGLAGRIESLIHDGHVKLESGVCGAETSGEGFQRHVEYIIEFESSLRVHLKHRFSEFSALHKALQRDFPGITLPDLPKSQWSLKLRRRNIDAAHVEEKRRHLDKYLKTLLELEGVKDSPHIANFFFGGAFEAAPPGTAIRQDPAARIVEHSEGTAIPTYKRYISKSDSGEMRGSADESVKPKESSSLDMVALHDMGTPKVENIVLPRSSLASSCHAISTSARLSIAIVTRSFRSLP